MISAPVAVFLFIKGNLILIRTKESIHNKAALVLADKDVREYQMESGMSHYKPFTIVQNIS